jgi:hypothetical protein
MVKSGATLMLVLTVAGGMAALVSEDRNGERLDDLETRVVRLEQLAGIPTSTPTEGSSTGMDGADGEDGNVMVSSGSSSVSSSQSSGTSSYSASYSSNGDGMQEFEISFGGTYYLTAHAGAGFSASIETADGEVIDGFPVESDDDGTLSVSAELVQGAYVLRVESESQWTVIITSMGD